MNTRVKICGLTRAEDVSAAISHGADYCGFVFASSPRKLTTESAVRLTRAVPDSMIRVGLFMDQNSSEVESVLEQVQLDMLQFHGCEDNAFCKRFKLPFIKAVSMREGRYEDTDQLFPDAHGLLLDSHEPGREGGTGKTFDWRLKMDSAKPTWLAGGLNPDNVAEAIGLFRPYAVDVSSGVEDAPGIKNHELIREFVENVRKQ